MISGTEECRGNSAVEEVTAAATSSTVELVGVKSRKDNNNKILSTNFSSIGTEDSENSSILTASTNEPTSLSGGTQRRFLCGQAAHTTSGERVLLINYVSPTATSSSPATSYNNNNNTSSNKTAAASSTASSSMDNTRKILHSRLLNPTQVANITPVSVAGLGSEVTVTITRSGKTSADHIARNKSKPKYIFHHHQNQQKQQQQQQQHQHQYNIDEEKQNYAQLQKEVTTTTLLTSALASSPPPLVFANSVHLHTQNEQQMLPTINQQQQQQHQQQDDKVSLTNLQTAESLLAPLDLQEEEQLAENDFREQHQQIIIEHQHPHQSLQHHFQHDEEQLLEYNNVEEVEGHHLHHLVNVHEHQECIQEQVEEVYIN